MSQSGKGGFNRMYNYRIAQQFKEWEKGDSLTVFVQLQTLFFPTAIINKASEG